MAECYKCGISGSSVRLFDAIGDEEIVKICANCLKEEDLPLIKKPTTFQLKEAETPSTVYERLSRAAGVDPKEHQAKFSINKRREEERLKKQEASLRELVEKNYESKVKQQEEMPRPDLIDNFHWVIMRARRMKKLTQDQLAKEIGEAESAIKMAEKGVLPEDDHKMVRKLEVFLGIKIRKGKDNDLPKTVDFKDPVSRGLTIADLKEIKAEHDTKEMTQEIEEDIILNEDFKMRLNEALDEGSSEFVK